MRDLNLEWNVRIRPDDRNSQANWLSHKLSGLLRFRGPYRRHPHRDHVGYDLAMNCGGWTSAAGICECFNMTMADLLTLCWWSQKDAKHRFQLAGLFDEHLGACCEVLMMRALQGHGFDWIDPLRLR